LDNGTYREVKQFRVDRSNNALNVGFAQFAPVIISFEAITSKAFSLTITTQSHDASIAEVELSSVPEVERFGEKTLAKMHPAPLPYWHEYQWAQQKEVTDKTLLVDEGSIKDIISNLSADGTLTWDVPDGEWVAMRSGMLPTGVQNSPASPEGT